MLNIGSDGIGSKTSTTAAGQQRALTADRTVRRSGIAVSTLAAIALVWFLSWAKGLLIPLSLAIFLAVCLAPAVNVLARRGVPRWLGAALVLLSLSALIGFAVSRTRNDVVQLLDQMPSATRYLWREISRTLDDPGSLAHRLQMLADLPETTVAGALRARSAPIAATPPRTTVVEDTRQAVEFTAELAAVLFLVYLLLAASGRLQAGPATGPALGSALSPRGRAIYAQFQGALHRYLGVLVLSNVLLGVAIWGALHLFGMARAGAWGVACALMHFVPYVGSALFVAGTVLVASVQFDSVARGLIVGGTALVLVTLIGGVLQVWWSGRSVRMNTVAVFVSLLFWSWLWGLPGLLLATPITLGLKVICRNIPDLEWLAALLDQHRREHRGSLRAMVLRTVQRVNPS